MVENGKTKLDKTIKTFLSWLRCVKPDFTTSSVGAAYNNIYY